MLFSHVIGQPEIKEHLVNTVKSGRISHARLFLANEGAGGLPLALAYARYLHCNNKGETDACGQCPSCKKYDKLQHPDFHIVVPVATTKDVTSKPTTDEFITPLRKAILANPYLTLTDWQDELDIENKLTAINVEEASRIMEKLSYKSYEGAFKIMLIWRAEKMNAQAANKLLKILEEPPDSTLFILVAENADMMLQTILSRTQLLKIKPIATPDIEAALIAQGSTADQAHSVAFLAEGSYREAQRLLLSDTDTYFPEFREWMVNCYNKVIPALVPWVDDFAKRGRETQRQFLTYGLHIIRECMMQNYVGTQAVRVRGNEQTFITRFAPFIKHDNGTHLMNEFNTAIEHIERNANPKILFMDLSLKMIAIVNKYRQ